MFYEGKMTNMSDESYHLFEEVEDELAAGMEASEKCEYDDRFILQNLMEGKSREEIAELLHHKNYKTIDMYMRRRGYAWNSLKKTYIKKPKRETVAHADLEPMSYKIRKIISHFDEGMDPMEVAKKVGMKDHRTMAMYMKSKGYYWSSEKHNYELKKGIISEEDDDFRADEIIYDDENLIEAGLSNMESLDDISRYKPLLEMLKNNKERVVELLGIGNNNTIPRYVIGGISITKSLSMCYTLSELVKEFSKEKNISQREIFEVALIEFLRKYGYESEVNALFSN